MNSLHPSYSILPIPYQLNPFIDDAFTSNARGKGVQVSDLIGSKSYLLCEPHFNTLCEHLSAGEQIIVGRSEVTLLAKDAVSSHGCLHHTGEPD